MTPPLEATVMASNQSNCASGQFAVGIDAHGNSEGCAGPVVRSAHVGEMGPFSSPFLLIALFILFVTLSSCRCWCARLKERS